MLLGYFLGLFLLPLGGDSHAMGLGARAVLLFRSWAVISSNGSKGFSYSDVPDRVLVSSTLLARNLASRENSWSRYDSRYQCGGCKAYRDHGPFVLSVVLGSTDRDRWSADSRRESSDFSELIVCRAGAIFRVEFQMWLPHFLCGENWTKESFRSVEFWCLELEPCGPCS